MSPSASTASGVWRPGAVTDALIAPPLDDLPEGALRDLRVRLVGDLASLVAELPRDEKLVLDDYHLRVATFDPERCEPGDTFAPSPRTTRRVIGVAAVDRCVRGRSSAPSAAVSEILAAALDDVTMVTRRPAHDATRPPWWARWYSGLGPGARAVVAAEAVTWSSQLWTAVAWERLDHTPVVGGRDDWWACPGAARLTLKGRAEVRVRCAGRQTLLVMAGGVPSPAWRIQLGFPALVAALVRGERGVPARVVGTWPACGALRILDIDARTLEASAAAVVAATGTWVDALIGCR